MTLLRALLAVAFLCVAQTGYAQACDTIVGWVGVPLCQAGGGGGDVTVPNVVGEANSTAADAVLQGVGLDLGAVTAHCSAATLDEIIAQNPVAGVEVPLGTLVDVTASNGMACAPGGGARLNLILRLGQQ